MTLITLPNTNITGANLWSQVEDNDKAIRDVVNGDLGADNLANGAVQTAKIADDAVTAAKLAPAVIQAGAATFSFSSANTTTAIVNHGLGTTPTSVTLTADRAYGGGTAILWNATVGNFTSTQFTIQITSIDGTAGTSAKVYWVAVGV